MKISKKTGFCQTEQVWIKTVFLNSTQPSAWLRLCSYSGVFSLLHHCTIITRFYKPPYHIIGYSWNAYVLWKYFNMSSSQLVFVNVSSFVDCCMLSVVLSNVTLSITKKQQKKTNSNWSFKRSWELFIGKPPALYCMVLMRLLVAFML